MLSALVVAAAVSLPVPYVPQEKDTCGAVALAMVLQYWGREASPQEIASALVEEELPGIRGSRLAELARERGMAAIAFAGDWSVVRDHLAKGRPIVVAIDAGHDRRHDVVVVGLDDESRQASIHDPARGPNRRVAVAELERKWAASGVSLGGSFRWQQNRKEAALQLQWPRPLGLPAVLRLAGFRGEQAYVLGSAFDMRRRGVDLGSGTSSAEGR